jgi:mannosylglycerate hydrolase MGH1-like protein
LTATGPAAPPRAPAAEHAGLFAAAEAVLRANWREGVTRDGRAYAYTCPSVPRYRHQWLWDSCFHAIAWRHFNPARARAELRTLLRAGRPDGFVPHTAFWGWPAGWRRAPFYATARPFGAHATETIGPPLIAVAWELVAAVSPPDFAAEGVAPLRAHLDWLAEHRDPDGDGLLSIIAPDESGLDDSPKYAPVFGRRAHDRPGYFLLLERARRRGYRSHEILASTDHQVEDVLVNVAYARSLRALARLAGDDAALHARAARTEAALLERCRDSVSGLFYDLAGRDERPVRVDTWSALAPLALPDLPDDVRRRIVEDHVLDPSRFGAPVGIPSVSMREPSFNPRWDRFRTWRGPSWVNTAWLLVPALRELGYDAEADAIVGSLARSVRAHGFREYYHPLTGHGLGAHRFGFSTLIVDLLAPAP